MNKDDKKKRKALYKQAQRDALAASLPMSIEQLQALFVFLDREDAPDCDHTLAQTNQFLASRNLDSDSIRPWLNDHGGFCDCEVLANVYDEVGDLIGWPLEQDD